MELFHHGVQGQKWGVRHGPPYPINYATNDTTIKRGTEFHRISRFDESVAKGHAYVTYLNEDNERYKGFFAAEQKVKGKGSSVYQMTLSAKHDMVSPSKQKRIETFIKMYENDPEVAKRLSSYHKNDEWNSFTPLPQKYYDKKYSDLKDEELVSKGYKTFVKAIGGDEYLRGEYFDNLSKQGYSFIQDDMDAGYLGNSPSIVFDRNKSLNYEGKKEVTSKEIMKNQYTYRLLVDSKTRRKIKQV